MLRLNKELIHSPFREEQTWGQFHFINCNSTQFHFVNCNSTQFHFVNSTLIWSIPHLSIPIPFFFNKQFRNQIDPMSGRGGTYMVYLLLQHLCNNISSRPPNRGGGCSTVAQRLGHCSVKPYLKGVSSLTSIHYLWRSLGPFTDLAYRVDKSGCKTSIIIFNLYRSKQYMVFI